MIVCLFAAQVRPISNRVAKSSLRRKALSIRILQPGYSVRPGWHATPQDLQPGVPTRRDLVAYGIARWQRRHVNRGVLMDGQRAVASVVGSHQTQLAGSGRFAHRKLLIPRRQALLFREEPDL